ncbi:hypothetical protein CFC21_091595 [Triticum aestivum]|uniref:PWWP domain-containing protein n=3 Tax=Triticinae TaxID=1648030 RepID=A0A453N6D4_AEGTS|nr:uncharacterized protein LOC109757159 isoform X1 [Aegilops tauschii subsp. strangulata]XP_044418455.1 uncharacterized protein LOC123143581 isoform X1 [Triticum aestivum]KAF7088494.1 hypothetical protein CFC21_091595 [Triticum aestivum]
MVKRSAEKSHGGMAACTSSSEPPELNPRQNFRLGDITWVKHDGSSWWPAQVIDEACASSKAKKKTSHDALVRLYGTCLDLYVDPWKSNMEFEMFLKKENKTAMEAFHEVLQKELSHFKSASDDEEEVVNTKAKTSTKKVRKQEGIEQDQEVRSSAKGGGAVQKGKKQKGVRQASALDKALSIDSAEGLRDKTPKQASVVRDKKSGKKASSGTSVAKKEGSSKRSGCTNLKDSDAAEDSTPQLHDTSASENAAEAGDMASVNRSQHKTGSTVEGTHRKIKAMVRDILLGDVIDRQLAAEMAYVDEVIFGICEATEAKAAATTETEGGLSTKRAASGLEADSSRAAKKKPRKGKATKPETKDPNSSPSRGAAAKGGSEQRSARQIKIMQSLGLIAPLGSPFDVKGSTAAAR